MLPPSDSISHHSRKLAEFAASLQNRHRGPAPPPYTFTTNPSAVPINEETFGSFEDEVDDPAETQLSPITIKIDASINVDGEGNTIVMPPSPSATPDAPGSGVPSASQKSSSGSPTHPTAPLQQLQERQKTKSSLLAETIISTLQSAGALEDSETGKQRPLDINVNAGVNIKGCKNVVCLGVPAKVSTHAEYTRDHVSGRKRRAESEPSEVPNIKRQPK